ncbi:hypothetical protein [Kitasatospora sp. NPDC098663]|uniref:hypothetical protein n=1 Tax=Kitasatospora sp. NPDC098663 TaxID=3364096 RepID=UPI0038142AFE
MPSSTTVTLAIDPALDTVATQPVDRRSRQWLEQAGFVRDDGTGKHRVRKDAPVVRIVSDAYGLLNRAGYDVLRLYSEQEQRQSATQPDPDAPSLTRAPGTIRLHTVAHDITTGHLVVHAQLREAAGSTRVLVHFPADGMAGILATEDTSFFGITLYPSLDEAVAAFGYPLTTPAPVPEARRAAATATSSAESTGQASGTARPDPAAPSPVPQPRAATAARL